MKIPLRGKHTWHPNEPLSLKLCRCYLEVAMGELMQLSVIRRGLINYGKIGSLCGVG